MSVSVSIFVVKEVQNSLHQKAYVSQKVQKLWFKQVLGLCNLLSKLPSPSHPQMQHTSPSRPICNIISSCSLPFLLQFTRLRSQAGWRGLWMERRASSPRTMWSSSNRGPSRPAELSMVSMTTAESSVAGHFSATEKCRVTDSAAPCQHQCFCELWCHPSPRSSQLTCGDIARNRSKSAGGGHLILKTERKAGTAISLIQHPNGEHSFCLNSPPNSQPSESGSKILKSLWGWVTALRSRLGHCSCLQQTL